MQYRLILQHPKPSPGVLGVLSVDKHGEAQFFSGAADKGSAVIAALQRVRIEHASSNGIFLSGVEQIGAGKLRFQEWWLIYIEVAGET